MLKLICLNIELNKHFSRNIPFLKSENPDVFCVQEIFEKDLAFVKSELGFKDVVFAPMFLLPYFAYDHPEAKKDIFALADSLNGNGSGYELNPAGIAIFSKTPIQNSQLSYYVGSPDKIHIHDSKSRRGKEGRVLLSTDIEKGGINYQVANTHFTWSAMGKPDEFQMEDVEKMLKIVESLGECILCGDFNAPRGDVIFSKISEKMVDNIPHEHKTTIDPFHHKSGKLDLVVDGLFSTPLYKVTNVNISSGVSDHMAIIASIEKMK